jgi:hypothetical protein
LGCFPEAHGLDFFPFLALDVRTLGRACVISVLCEGEEEGGEHTGGREDGREHGRDGVRGGGKKKGESTYIYMSLSLTHSRQHCRCW